MKFKLLFLILIIFSFYSIPVLAEEFQEIDTATLSGYYSTDKDSFLILGNGTVLEISDITMQSSVKSSTASAYSNGNEVILITDDNMICLVPLDDKGKTTSGGIYYAIYSDYKGEIDEVEFQEGSEVMFGDNIFGNDYIVAVREPLSTFFSINTSSIDSSLTMEGNGYESPEEAVTAYLDAFQQGDLDKMISTFAIETFVENYNLDKQIERMGIYLDAFKYIPPIGAYAQAINLESRRSDITNYIRYQYLILTNSTVSDGDINRLPEDETGSEYLGELFAMDDSNIFSSFMFDGEFYDPVEIYENYYSETNMRNMQIVAGVYGCDDLQSIVAEFSVDDTPYILCMDVANYDGTWFNVSSIGTIGSILGLAVSSGGICPVSEIW